MRALPSTPEPYTVRLSPLAAKQLAELPPGLQSQAHSHLSQLADLASFAAGYSLSVDKINSLVADSGGISIRYDINDAGRSLTVLELRTP
jgi:mRNA-degrading endonuclease RelE of RelBE toxin-antitoxin system